MRAQLIPVLCSVLLCLEVWVEANLYTALAGVEPLIETHGIVINHLNEYIVQEEKRLSVLKKNLELFKQEHTKAMRDVPNYLGNPLNVFTLIKRLTTDLQNIERSVILGTELIKDVTSSQHAIYPTEEDLVGAAEALTRLQDTYKLNITELARGELNGITYSTPLTASDCFELGKALFNQYDYQNSLLWMMEAINKIKREKEIHITLKEEEILEYISYIHYEMGNFENAVNWNKALLALSPNHPKALKNMPFYEYALNNNVKNTGPEVDEETNTYDEEMKTHKEKYEALCRGDLELSPKVTKILKCRYLHDNNPFLKIAPFKVEQLHINPDVFLFYDVINDDEIDIVKNLSKPRLQRAKVYNYVERIAVKYRIAMSAWLADEESPVIKRISQRVSDMTGLSTDSAENLQIGNYGIGGHYEPHFDFSVKGQIEDDNRIATVLFYMSEVAQGGATVFTELGLTVFPVKNAALFWMNLHPSGEGDFATRHAACPVLRGSKWVCNKWIHQSGQEFLKPCDLEYQEEGYSINYKIPVYKEND